MDTVPPYIQRLTPAMLLPLVRQVTTEEIIQVTDWQCHELHGGSQGGVYRVAGTARTPTAAVPWSLILKIPPTIPSIGDPFGGTREPLLYRSGFLQQLPGMLRAPRCFGVVAMPAGGHVVWLEDIHDDSPLHWSLAHYGHAAFILGQLNGAFMAGWSLPSWAGAASPLVVRHFVDCFLHPSEQVHAAVEYAVSEFGLSRQDLDRFEHIYAQRHWYLDLLDDLPQTLCHGDADRRNLMVRRLANRQEELVAIDWAWAGRGAVGQDVGRLVNNSVLWGQVPPTELGAVEAIAFTNYLQGLQDVGWQGDTRHVRCGYAAYIVLAESLVTLGFGLVLLSDPRSQALATQILGASMDDILARIATLLAYHVRLADEARALWATLS